MVVQGISSCQISDQYSVKKTRGHALIMDDCLNDSHINLTQELLRRQLKNLSGLKSSISLTKLKEPLPITDAVQVLHTTIGCSVGKVNVFDSLYSLSIQQD